MKKIVIAVDSFKGSVSSEQVGQSIASALRERYGAIETAICPIADGGEGLTESLGRALNGKRVELTVSDPLLRPIRNHYYIIHNNTALLEMASCSGLALLTPDEQNPLHTSTRGVGETILDALTRGCRRFIVGIGGSATNDGGMGMLHALGFRFFDARGNELPTHGAMLSRVERIDGARADGRLSDCTFKIACDVTNPLYGPTGASYTYAPQKGATPTVVAELDNGLRNWAKRIKAFNGRQIETLSGSGAAGGLGGGFAGMLNASLQSGISLVLECLKFDRLIADADLIITGEGRMDHQTVMGKAPWGVLQAGSAQRIPVIAIAGQIEDRQTLLAAGFSRLIEISPRHLPLAEAMRADVTIANLRRAIYTTSLPEIE